MQGAQSLAFFLFCYFENEKFENLYILFCVWQCVIFNFMPFGNHVLFTVLLILQRQPDWLRTLKWRHQLFCFSASSARKARLLRHSLIHYFGQSQWTTCSNYTHVLPLSGANVSNSPPPPNTPPPPFWPQSCCPGSRFHPAPFKCFKTWAQDGTYAKASLEVW